MSDNSQDLRTIQQKRIFFGHQSVGVNILDGIKDIVSENTGSALSMLSADSLRPTGESFFADAKIGRNTDPASKCYAFSETIERLGGNIDIALMKFCYVDITSSSKIDSILDTYISTIQTLKSKFPHITFVHVTVPLTSRSGGIKQFIKSLIGYKSTSDLDNISRNEFNKYLTEKVRGEPIFDLATVESSYPDGRRETFEEEGKIYYSLIDAYTSDGGHLNELGRATAAKALIKVLSAVRKTN